jgi:hypothetical protein
VACGNLFDEMESDYYGQVTKSATTFLARWNGGFVRVRELTVSHRTLAIVVFRDYQELSRWNFCIRADPLWMCGPFEWRPAALQVDVVAASETPVAAFTQDNRLFRLRDPVGFELLSSSLELAENAKLT